MSILDSHSDLSRWKRQNGATRSTPKTAVSSYIIRCQIKARIVIAANAIRALAPEMLPGQSEFFLYFDPSDVMHCPEVKFNRFLKLEAEFIKDEVDNATARAYLLTMYKGAQNKHLKWKSKKS